MSSDTQLLVGILGFVIAIVLLVAQLRVFAVHAELVRIRELLEKRLPELSTDDEAAEEP